MVKNELTQAFLKERLEYNPDTGLFKWIKPYRKKDRGWFGGKPNMTAGYHCISFNNKTYLSHRIAYLYMAGKFPSETIDHKDGDKCNNRWENIRSCTYQENNLNVRRTRANTSGCKGVDWRKEKKLWRVRCSSHFIGHYKDYDIACLAAEEARNKYHKGFANHD